MAPTVTTNAALKALLAESTKVRASGAKVNKKYGAYTTRPKPGFSYTWPKIEKGQLSGRLIRPTDGRAYLEGIEKIKGVGPEIEVNVESRKYPVVKRSKNNSPNRYSIRLKAKERKKGKQPKFDSGSCPLCIRNILPEHDVVYCNDNSCRPVHRRCAEEYYGRKCLCMGLLCDWHPDGRWPDGQYFNNRDACISCGGEWFPTIPDVVNKWGMVMATTHFGEYIERHYPDIPRQAYNLNHTWLEPNFDFEDFGRNPMNVVRDQLTFGASLDEAKENTWIAYNGNHHPLIDGSPPPALYCSVTKEEYIDAIDAGYFETAVYTGYTCDRLFYFHNTPFNILPFVRNPTGNHRLWFNFCPDLLRLFHLRPSQNGPMRFYRKVFEAAPGVLP